MKKPGKPGGRPLFGAALAGAAAALAGALLYHRHIRGRMLEANRELSLSEQRFRIAVSQTSDLVFDYNPVTHVARHFNTGSADYGMGELVDDVPESLIRSGIVQPESAGAFRGAYREILEGKKTSSCIMKTRLTNGSFRWNLLTLTNIFDEHGRPVRAVGSLKDVTRQKEAEMRYAQEEQYRAAVVGETILTYEANITQDRLLRGYEDWPELFGTTLTDNLTSMLRQTTAHTIDPDYRKAFLDTFGRTAVLAAFGRGKRELTLEYRRLNLENRMVWVLCTMHLLQDPSSGDVLSFAYVKDIDQQKQEAMKLQFLAERDQLTGLYNKATTEARIREALRAGGGVHALVMADLDNFKSVNDSMGHLNGDKALTEIAGRLQRIFRQKDVVGRVGGDEFMILIRDIGARENARQKAQAVCEAFREPVRDTGQQLSGTVGVAMAPEDGKDFCELYRKADQALYEAKRKGKNQFAFF